MGQVPLFVATPRQEGWQPVAEASSLRCERYTDSIVVLGVLATDRQGEAPAGDNQEQDAQENRWAGT